MSVLRPPSGISMPASREELKYSIPYGWGNLHVTEAAHDQYGLVPLVPTVEGGNFGRPDKDDGTDQADIFLTGRPERVLSEDDLGHEHALDGLFEVHGRGVAVALNLPDPQAIKDEFMRFACHITDLPESEIGDRTNEDGISLHDYTDNETPQILARTLSSVAGSLAKAGFIEYLNEQSARRDHRNIIRPFKLGAVATSLAGTADILLTELTETDYINTPIIAISQLAVASIMSWRHLRDHMNGLPDTHAINEKTADLRGTLVSNDIHTSYDRAHFDERFGGGDATGL